MALMVVITICGWLGMLGGSAEMAGVASIAPGLVIIVGLIVGIVLMDHSSAILAGGVIPIITALTQGRVVVTGIIVCPKPLSAPLTAECFCLQAGSTKQIIIKLCQLQYRMQLAATITSSHFFFQVYYLHNKNSTWM